ncbi:MAG: AMP-binding protein [Thermodesulfobacteriota bacterium]
MIKAKLAAENPDANLKSYKETYERFAWEDAYEEFTWHQTGKVNIVHEAVDRWADDENRRNHKALIFEKAGKVEYFTYGDLSSLSSQWANLLIEYGFSLGDRVFIFLPPCPEVYLAMLACARLGVIFCVLFPTSSYDEIGTRIRSAKPKGIITHPGLAERLPTRAMGCVKHVFLAGGSKPDLFNSEVMVQDQLKGLPKKRAIRWVSDDTPLYLTYTTSGTVWPPKAVVHAHRGMVGHLVTARYVLDIKENTILWTDAGEPGWVTGIVYGTFAPWLCGVTSVVQGDPFSASTWYRTLERHHVTVWYTTPRTITRLMEAGDDLPLRYDLTSLRHIATVGEVLSPDQLYWTRQNLKLTPHDTWWMSETGMICLANFPSTSVRPGSMGRPVPGIEAAVLNDLGERLPEFTMGELALKCPWPSMMIALWEDEERYKEYFRFDGWFLTGDMVTKDEEGYYFYDGRNDDLIKVGTQDTGPYELEQILGLHQAVAESAVISVKAPDEKPAFKIFVRLKEPFHASQRLSLEIENFLRAYFPPDIPLAGVVFMDDLPRTRSGKPLRSVLIAQELGVPSGDPTRLSDQ